MALGLVRNAGQRENRPVPWEWGGMAGIAALGEAAHTSRYAPASPALRFPPWRSHL